MIKQEVIVRNENRVSAAQLEQLLSAQLDMIRKSPAQAKVLPPLMVWGPPALASPASCVPSPSRAASGS